MEEIEAASRNDTCHSDEDDMRVISSFSLARDGLRAKVNQKDHVIELKDGLVEEDCQAPEAL